VDSGGLYIDPREGNGPIARTGRHIDLVIDEAADQGEGADRTMIDGKLRRLFEQQAPMQAQLGYGMRPTPAAVRGSAWSKRAVNVPGAAPVSALVMPTANPT